MYLSICNIIENKYLDIHFLESKDIGENELVAANDRTLFYKIINIENFPESIRFAFERLKIFFNGCGSNSLYKSLLSVDFSSNRLVEQISSIAEWNDSPAIINNPFSEGYSDEILHHLLLQIAPTAILDGYYLNEVSNAATSHTSVAALLHRIQARKVGKRHYPDYFVTMLNSLELTLPHVDSEEFANDKKILDSSLQFPLFQMCLSLFPGLFLPEILGVTLYSSLSKMSPLFMNLKHEVERRHGATAYFNLFTNEGNDNDVDYCLVNSVAAIKTYLESCGSTVDQSPTLIIEAKKRILQGFAVSWDICRQWLNAVDLSLAASWLNPRTKMLHLINRKAPYAKSYHSRIKLDKCPFDKLLAGDPEKFIDALAKSSFISPGNSKKSRLLTKSIAFGGPMFRIFTEEELNTIAQWIDSLKADKKLTDKQTDVISEENTVLSNCETLLVRTSPKDHNILPIHNLSIELNYDKATIRELYYYLINLELFPSIRPFAKKFVTNWLHRAAVGMNSDTRAIPFAHYQHQAFKNWFYQKHQEQVNTYVESIGKNMPSQTREQIIHDSIQICPMILIDGAWLQKWGLPHNSRSAIGRRLFRIYSDEIGNGDIELNHPNIYRTLMTQMGIDLPELNSVNFYQWSRFEDVAFQVPVFWLCISLYLKQFLPETLGLNLAMEISGVSGTYRIGSDVLKHYGYSPLFIDLHNTIDNFSTGHSALAQEAIQIYMDEIMTANNNDQNIVTEHWNRIWTGYRSLIPPKDKYFTAVIAKAKQLYSLISLNSN